MTTPEQSEQSTRTNDLPRNVPRLGGPLFNNATTILRMQGETVMRSSTGRPTRTSVDDYRVVRRDQTGGERNFTPLVPRCVLRCTLPRRAGNKRLRTWPLERVWWKSPLGAVCCPCLALTCLYGLYPKMKLWKKITCSCLGFSLTAILIGVIFFNSLYSDNAFEATRREQRALTSKYSTLFCEEFTISSSDGNEDLYLFDFWPRFLAKKEVDEFTYPSEYRCVSWFYPLVVPLGYLLEGSAISMKVDVVFYHDELIPGRIPFAIYLIQGDGNLQAWKDNGCCHSTKSINGTLLKYNVTASDSYYFGIKNEGRPYRSCSISARAHFNLKKTKFDLHGQKQRCTTQMYEPCTFDIEFGSSDVIILDSAVAGTTKIETHCKPRVEMYILAFLAVPLTLLISWCIMLWLCFRHRNFSSEMIPNLNSNATEHAAEMPGIQLVSQGVPDYPPPQYQECFEHGVGAPHPAVRTDDLACLIRNQL